MVNGSFNRLARGWATINLRLFDISQSKEQPATVAQLGIVFSFRHRTGLNITRRANMLAAASPRACWPLDHDPSHTQTDEQALPPAHQLVLEFIYMLNSQSRRCYFELMWVAGKVLMNDALAERDFSLSELCLICNQPG
jgi:hypothetical protein